MKKKKFKFVDAPPIASDINEANALIEELWEQLRHYDTPFYRHQVYEIPKPTVEISEYRLFSNQCRHCHEVVRAKKPDNVPQGIIGPNLLSYIAVLVGQYHLSVRKITRATGYNVLCWCYQRSLDQIGFNVAPFASCNPR